MEVSGSRRVALLQAVSRLADPPGPELRPVVAALGLERVPTSEEHREVFIYALPAYASVLLDPAGRPGGRVRERVADLLTELGFLGHAEPDHLATLLAVFLQLSALDLAPVRAEAPAALRSLGSRDARRLRRTLLHEHLWPWVPRWAARVIELGPAPYRQWADLLLTVLAAERDDLGVPTTLPEHLRATPDAWEPADGTLAGGTSAGGTTAGGTAVGGGADGSDADLLVADLLAPVRSGLVLTRPDLHRAATELGVDLPSGERTDLLRALLAGESVGSRRWLATEARRQALALSGVGLASSDADPVDTTAAFWQILLASTAARLDVEAERVGGAKDRRAGATGAGAVGAGAVGTGATGTPAAGAGPTGTGPAGHARTGPGVEPS